MEGISVFDMLKIGVGPSSSHTLGPWRAAREWVSELDESQVLDKVKTLTIELYGSLSLTGKGHATDIAVVMGLLDTNPETVETLKIPTYLEAIEKTQTLPLGGRHDVKFSVLDHIIFKKSFLPFHANGMRFLGELTDGTKVEETYYSVGGGFIVKENESPQTQSGSSLSKFPWPIAKGEDILTHCGAENKPIWEIVLGNERQLRNDIEIDAELKRIWQTMLHCMYEGCHTEGILPGGLNVKRRAFQMHEKLKGDVPFNTPEEWVSAIRKTEVKFRQIFKWVSCFALAVNEVNAAMGRVVTAPTNGSAGVIPAVLMYYLVIENHEGNFEHVKRFLLVAGEIGSVFKKGATISAAMGGCQAEIGVSSAMAAGALCELLGGTPDQVVVAAEIAMEHHLGLTCDPIGGLVQVPCIERNSMGAIKAINAAELALETNPEDAKVPLDKVIKTMWETAKDMNSKYKETSEGGLAVGVNLSDC
ncbi:MAG: L-serine ammonia-lyase [Bacteroidota bacterium]